MKKSFKKGLIILSLFALITSNVLAAAYNPESKVKTLGQALLSKNGITISDVQFEVSAKANANSSSFSQDKVVTIQKDKLKYSGNDNETAYVVANELGHIISGHYSKDKFISSVVSSDNSTSNDPAASLVENYTQTKQEKEADVIAVNLMANAGYNPLAGIVVLTKQTQTAWNVVLGKPANADRAMNIYDYTTYAYPAKTKAGYNCQEYKNFLEYANTILNERKENKKLENKSQKELKKQRKNSLSQITKFKTRGAKSSWDAAYEILNGTLGE